MRAKVVRVRRPPRGTRQIYKLRNFIEYEHRDAESLEYLCDLNGTKLSYQELSVLLFIKNKEYLRKLGSLVCLYRIWKSEQVEGVTQRERYALYYRSLQEWGYL